MMIAGRQHRARGLLAAAGLFALLAMAACGGDECGGSGDCGGSQVCAECKTLTGSCNKCVEPGDVEVCTCL